MSQPRRLVSAAMCVGLLILCAAPRPAHAKEGFQRHLNAAIRLYESLEYERAIKQLQLASGLPHSSEDEVELSLYEGIIQAELGQQDESRAAFKSALLVQPEARLPVKVAPKVNQLFESVREQATRELAALAARRPEPSGPELSPALPVTPVVPTHVPTVAQEAPARSALRRHALLPAVAGGALVVAGGISWTVSRGELSRLRDNTAALQSQQAVQQSVSRGKTFQTLGVALMGVGTAGLVTATGLYFLGAPRSPTSVGLTTDGRSAFVYGRWP